MPFNCFDLCTVSYQAQIGVQADEQNICQSARQKVRALLTDATTDLAKKSTMLCRMSRMALTDVEPADFEWSFKLSKDW